MSESTHRPAVAKDEGRPFDELRDTGLLWLINRQVFHPRGFALQIHRDIASGEVTGWSLGGDGIEPWNFVDGSENDLLAAANRTLSPHKPRRELGSGAASQQCQHGDCDRFAVYIGPDDVAWCKRHGFGPVQP